MRPQGPRAPGSATTPRVTAGVAPSNDAATPAVTRWPAAAPPARWRSSVRSRRAGAWAAARPVPRDRWRRCGAGRPTARPAWCTRSAGRDMGSPHWAPRPSPKARVEGSITAAPFSPDPRSVQCSGGEVATGTPSTVPLAPGRGAWFVSGRAGSSPRARHRRRCGRCIPGRAGITGRSWSPCRRRSVHHKPAWWV